MPFLRSKKVQKFFKSAPFYFNRYMGEFILSGAASAVTVFTARTADTGSFASLFGFVKVKAYSRDNTNYDSNYNIIFHSLFTCQNVVCF